DWKSFRYTGSYNGFTAIADRRLAWPEKRVPQAVDMAHLIGSQITRDKRSDEGECHDLNTLGEGRWRIAPAERPVAIGRKRLAAGVGVTITAKTTTSMPMRVSMP